MSQNHTGINKGQLIYMHHLASNLVQIPSSATVVFHCNEGNLDVGCFSLFSVVGLSLLQRLCQEDEDASVVLYFRFWQLKLLGYTGGKHLVIVNKRVGE